MECKIAVVDSGIDLKIYEKYVTEYIEFCSNEDESGTFDSNGHGTLCCSTILSVNSNIKFVIIKVLNQNNLCSDERLLCALRYLTEMDVDIINLSLSTDSVEYLEEYKKIFIKLKGQGKVIVAATKNGNKPSIITNLPEVIGVYGGIFRNYEDYWYQRNKNIQCVTNNIPYLVKGFNGKYELFGGNSKATALFTGIISKHWNEIKNLTWHDRDRVLELYAKNKKWDLKDIRSNIDEIQTVQICKDKGYYRLKEYLINYFQLSSDNLSSLYEGYLYELGITRFNAITFIEEIEKNFGVIINYSKVNLLWFISIDSLYENLKKEGISMFYE